MLSIHDAILYGNYGVCQIVDIRQENFCQKGTLYYVLSPIDDPHSTIYCPVGMVFAALIFAGGHVINIAINALGAYVHSSRLQYVEFFGKFYDGGGRLFAPLAARGKYHQVMDGLKK